MKKGDQVVTGGGLVGKVIKVDDNLCRNRTRTERQGEGGQADCDRCRCAGRQAAGERLTDPVPRRYARFPALEESLALVLTLAGRSARPAVAVGAQRSATGPTSCPIRRSISGSTLRAAAISCSRRMPRRLGASGWRAWKKTSAPQLRQCRAAHPHRRHFEQRRPGQLPAATIPRRSIAAREELMPLINGRARPAARMEPASGRWQPHRADPDQGGPRPGGQPMRWTAPTEVVRKRIDALGTREPTIIRQGAYAHRGAGARARGSRSAQGAARPDREARIQAGRYHRAAGRRRAGHRACGQRDRPLCAGHAVWTDTSIAVQAPRRHSRATR